MRSWNAKTVRLRGTMVLACARGGCAKVVDQHEKAKERAFEEGVAAGRQQQR